MAYVQGQSRSQTSLFPVSLEGLIPRITSFALSTFTSPSWIWCDEALIKHFPKAPAGLLTIQPIS
jgi:hypothetical protein